MRELTAEVERLRAAVLAIERAIAPDPHDERDVSIEWLRATTRAVVSTARKDGK